MKYLTNYNIFNENKSDCVDLIFRIKTSIRLSEYNFLYHILKQSIKCDINKLGLLKNTLFQLFIHSLPLKESDLFDLTLFKNIIDVFISNGATDNLNSFQKTPISDLISQNRLELIEHIINNHKNYKIKSYKVWLNLTIESIDTENIKRKIQLLQILQKSNFDFLTKNAADYYFFNLLPTIIKEQFPDITKEIEKREKKEKFNL